MEVLDPHPYGEFSTVNELAKVVDQRRQQSLGLYGHALIYPVDDEGNIINRIGARVSQVGEIFVNVHCENI